MAAAVPRSEACPVLIGRCVHAQSSSRSRTNTRDFEQLLQCFHVLARFEILFPTLHFPYRRMSYHQLGMRTGVMKHGYVHFLCTIVSSIRFACFLSWLCRGYTLAALGCDSSRIPLEIFVSFLAATDFTIFFKHFNFPRLMFFVPRGGRPARTLGVGRSVRLSSLGSSASFLIF